MVLSDIRKSAREALSGKWGKAILILLAYFLFTFALGFVSGLVEDIALLSLIVEIATVVVSIPVSFGLIASFIKLKRGEEVKAFDFITYGFTNFSKGWKVAGNMLLKMWLPILLYVLATIAFSFITAFGITASAMSDSASLMVIAMIVGIALFIAAFVYLFITSLSYSLSYFIAYDNEAMSGKEVVEKSKEMMKGNRGKYVLLQLSFIGWVILSIFTLYIGMLWLTPYMQVAMVCFYEALKDKKVEE